MDNNRELRKATVARKKQPGFRCLNKQRDGGYALSIGVAGANFSADQLRQFAELVEKYGKAGHISTAQSLIVVGIPEDQHSEALRAALEAGFDVRSVGRDVRQVKCCPGADYSPFGRQKTLPLATLLEDAFRGLPTPLKFKVAISGCPNSCSGVKMNDFGAHGTKDGWKVFAGGKMGVMPVIAEELANGVSEENVPKYMAAVLRVYRDEGTPNERLAKMVARIGVDTFKARVASYVDKPYDDLVELARTTREQALSNLADGQRPPA